MQNDVIFLENFYRNSSFELLTRLRKTLISVRVTNSRAKLLFFHFRVTNSKLKNLPRVTNEVRKTKKQNLDFKVARDFFLEMKYYTIQNYLRK